MSRYAWLAGDRRLAEIGIKSYPMRGIGTDFKQLADYRPGERSAISTGRRPCARAARSFASSRTSATRASSSCSTAAGACAPTKAAARRGSHFDAALDALMLLAYVALKEGDEVGAMTFGGRQPSTRGRAEEGRAPAERADRNRSTTSSRRRHPDYRAAATT